MPSALITLLASAALTTQIWYALFFFIYLVIGVWTSFSSLDARTGRTGGSSDHVSPPTPPVTPFPRLTLRFFGTTNAMAAGAFGFTLLFFFSIPRVGSGSFSTSKSGTTGILGTGRSRRHRTGEAGSGIVMQSGTA